MALPQKELQGHPLPAEQRKLLKTEYARFAFLLCVLCAFMLALFKASGWQFTFGFRMPQPVAQGALPGPASDRKKTRTGTPLSPPPIMGKLNAHFASGQQSDWVDGVSLLELRDGRVRAFWRSSSRADAGEVTINSAVFDPIRDVWSEANRVAGRANTQRDLNRYIANIGNPVAARAANGEIWLFYVGDSWRGNAIVLITSTDEGEHWSQPRHLVTAPVVPLGTRIEQAPFLYADGTLGLLVNHDFGGQFAAILRLDKTGKVIDKQRLSVAGQRMSSTVLLVHDLQQAQVLGRVSGAASAAQMRSIATRDGGRHWPTVQGLTLSNSNAMAAMVRLNDGDLISVLNDQAHGYESLSLQRSVDGGQHWRELHRLEEMSGLRNAQLSKTACLEVVGNLLRSSDPVLRRADATQLAPYVALAEFGVRKEEGCHFAFTDPAVLQTRNGDIHLAYTWNRTFIKHVRIDPAWLKQRVQEMP
ncbi:exo-alpha-sialidase [Ferrigenium sp. UT5]|uniref:exo-alpha-sialidase n=1 Tax=Ferrigenium sp. UT5 TaxID=3242105 RepID=UPI003551305F